MVAAKIELTLGLIELYEHLLTMQHDHYLEHDKKAPKAITKGLRHVELALAHVLTPSDLVQTIEPNRRSKKHLKKFLKGV